MATESQPATSSLLLRLRQLISVGIDMLLNQSEAARLEPGRVMCSGAIGVAP